MEYFLICYGDLTKVIKNIRIVFPVQFGVMFNVQYHDQLVFGKVKRQERHPETIEQINGDHATFC
jgi:hypothetical protein